MEAAPLVPPLLYILHVDALGVDAEVWLNGVPLFRERHGGRRGYESKVNMYIREGQNDLRVLVRPAVDAEGRWVTGPQTFELQMLKGFLGSEIGPEGLLIVHPEPVPGRGFARNGLVHLWQGSFEVTEAFGAWTWELNAPGLPTASDRDAIGALLAMLHSAFVARDADMLDRLLWYKSEEICRSLGLARERWDQWQSEEFAERFGSPDWAMEPIDLDALVLHPYADGRLIAVTNRDGRPVLRGADPSTPFSLEPMFAFVDGHWYVVR